MHTKFYQKVKNNQFIYQSGTNVQQLYLLNIFIQKQVMLTRFSGLQTNDKSIKSYLYKSNRMQSQSFQGKPILCKAAVAYEAKKPLVVEDIFVDPPKQGQIRIKVISNALCHTDIYTLDGCDPQGKFPCILGHEATGVVESIGKGVTRVVVGDVVIPCYTPQCNEKKCIYCQHEKSNLCPKIRSTQGAGVMPDGTTRFRTKDGKDIFHFMGCSTFSEYTVIAEISAAKVNKNADLNKVCMIGCGVATGWGAAINNTTVTPGSTVAVWGLGAVGLAVIQAAKSQGAGKIYAIDTNEQKFQIAKKFGADVCHKPTGQKNGKTWLLEQQKWGINFTYDCTGNVNIMRQALEASHRGFGQSCVIGVAQSGKQISTRSFQLVTGRKWVGTAFGGWKSTEDVPKLVNKAALGEWPIDAYVTHEIQGLDKVNDAIHALHHDFCLRAVVKISDPPRIQEKIQIKVTGSVKLQGGALKTVSHWSKTTNSFMNFNIYLPQDQVNQQRGQPYPALYFLSGLTCTHDNAPQKSGFARFAKKHRIAVVFPDTSPRNTGIQGIAEDWQAGESASYYVNATSDKCKQYYQMFTYINEELPELVSTYFPVSRTNVSISGFSMGGHGALISALKTGKYKSVSAFAPISNPSKSTNWGIKAFKLFFEKPEVQGKQYDTTEIIKSGNFHKVPTFIDCATADQNRQKMLIDNLKEQMIESDYPHLWKNRAGYNHSFFYVSTFIEEHIDFHAKYLNYETL